MKRFLATTAMALALAMPAAAQTADDQTYLQQAEEGDIRSSDFVGMRVYTSEADLEAGAEIGEEARAEWEDVGEINDVLMTREGQVKAILLDVGGFLGMGEKTIAVEMEELQFLTAEGGAEEFLVFKGSRETLEAAPEFEDREMEQAQVGSGAEVMGGARSGSATGGTRTTEVPVTVADEETAAEETVEDAGDEVREETDSAAVEMTAESEEEAQVRAEGQVLANDRAEAGASGAMIGRREGWTQADAGELTAEELQGAEVYDANDESIGEVSELILNDDGRISQAVIEVGGFLGLGAHQVAVPFDDLHVMREGDAGDALRIYVDVSKAELEAMPEHEG